MSNIDILRQGIEDFGIEASDKMLADFQKYKEILVEWNQKMNLTGIEDEKEVFIKHFLDSVSAVTKGYIKNGMSLIDVGTGAGFPGIPLAIMNESLKITLVDSLNKRLIFLQEVINELNLKNIQAVHGRAEEYIREKREHYDIATSRAVAKLNVLLEYMIPFVKVGGRCICMKSFEIDEELKDAEKAIEILGGKIEKVDEITLPNTDIQRKIVVIKKIKSTPNKYPRKAGMPLKEPIL